MLEIQISKDIWENKYRYNAETECFYCHEFRNINDMVVDKRRKNGHGTCCKNCDSKRKRR